MRTQRAEMRQVLEGSPILNRQSIDRLVRLYADAAADASEETGLPPETFPATCPYTVDQILDRHFRPE